MHNIFISLFMCKGGVAMKPRPNQNSFVTQERVASHQLRSRPERSSCLIVVSCCVLSARRPRGPWTPPRRRSRAGDTSASSRWARTPAARPTTCPCRAWSCTAPSPPSARTSWVRRPPAPPCGVASQPRLLHQATASKNLMGSVGKHF